VVDAERTTELFEQLDEKDKIPTAYNAAIRAYLRLQNLSDAITLNEAALLKFDDLVGSDQLLAYMIDRSMWSHAFKTWGKYRTFQKRFPQNFYDIFAMALKLPTLPSRTFQFADYVNMKIGSLPRPLDGSSAELLEFASRIVKHVLSSDATSDQSKFTKLLQILENWGADTRDVYETAIQRLLLDQKNTKPAVKLYRKTLRGKEIKYSPYVLHTLLSIFCKNHSILGMQQVLDDFFRFYKRPSRRAYQLCMKEFASQGDADTVHTLFDQYTSRFQAEEKLELSADEFAPLLHVHAKRGELAAVKEAFNDLRDHYKLEPTLLCWNIVLNAYGKVNDSDGAFAFFDQLLETTGLRPDDYTFGTMIGICATSGDRARATELYQLADSMGVEKSITMIDSLVLTYLKDEHLTEAEKMCEDALKTNLKGSRTRMWNYLLVAYAMRRDLVNVNRLLRRMSEAKIDYDGFTYSALMQALAMVKQPDRARAIMDQVMKEAGITPTNFHYAVLMGGYVANGEFHKVFYVQNQMVRRGVRNSASSRLLVMKAAAAEDQKLLENGKEQELCQRALQMFQETISTMDPMDISQSAKKGTNRIPLDIAYSSMFNSFVMFVLSQRNELETVSAIYEQYLQTLPESRRESPPVQILSALMISKMRALDFEGVQECWDLAVSQARMQGRGVPSSKANRSTSRQPAETPTIVPDHKLDLTEILTHYMIALAKQRRVDDIPPLINALLEEGFLLNNNNWNHYIQLMARRYRYKLAFELCETKLMTNWTGWARIRWQNPERNRLPVEVRNLKKMPNYLRPKSHTFLYLARGYLELQSMAAESPAQQIMLAELERSCPKTTHAIRTMQRVDDPLEREVLRDYVV
jgi:pentatricopeptide repeat-containing protein PET309